MHIEIQNRTRNREEKQAIKQKQRQNGMLMHEDMKKWKKNYRGREQKQQQIEENNIEMKQM